MVCKNVKTWLKNINIRTVQYIIDISSVLALHCDLGAKKFGEATMQRKNFTLLSAQVTVRELFWRSFCDFSASIYDDQWLF